MNDQKLLQITAERVFKKAQAKSNSEPFGEKKVMTVEEAAGPEWLDIGLRQAYALAGQGKLPGCFRLGRRFIVSRSALERYIESGGKSET